MPHAAHDPRTALPGLLVERGFRLTGPRRAVLDAVSRRGTPFTAAEIHARLRTRRVNLVSVYRTLHLLSDLGVLRVADASNGARRFELGEAFTGHHHHLVCERCGAVEEVNGCLLPASTLRQLGRRIRRARRFRVLRHDLKLLGLCRRCVRRRP
ncbi:MAG TPA: transcriptional repressor [Methylomirabilota bacterium]|nr:transcriptional repressor [Methylomirabilota bacterium]